MSKNRTKVAPRPILPREEMEWCVARHAALKVREQSVTASLNDKIETARSIYAPELDTISEELDLHGLRIREWAEANPEAFGKLRSLDLTHAVIGWRTGNPTLKTLRGWTWDRVLEALKSVIAPNYIRISEEVNKQALLDDRAALGDVGLKQFGVEVKQTDSFFIEAKIVQPEKREAA